MFGATEIYFGTKVKIDKRLRDEILKEWDQGGGIKGSLIFFSKKFVNSHNKLSCSVFV